MGHCFRIVAPISGLPLFKHRRAPADGAVARLVVGVYEVQYDIYPAHGASFGQICQYPSLDNFVEPLYYGRPLLAVRNKVLDTVAIH